MEANFGDAFSVQDIPVTAPSSPSNLPTAADLPPVDALSESDEQPAKKSKAKHRRHPTLHTPNLPIPDLRYEQAFLASIRSCVTVYPDEAGTTDEKALVPAEGYTPAAGTEWWVAKNIKIAWGSLFYKIAVNQVISQGISGAVFSVLGLGYLSFKMGLRNLLRKPGAIARPPPLVR